jgi:hypothetical protein
MKSRDEGGGRRAARRDEDGESGPCRFEWGTAMGHCLDTSDEGNVH